MAKGVTPFWRKVFNFIAFVSVTMIGIALMLSWILRNSGNNISGILMWVATILAFVVVCFYSLFYALSKRRGASLVLHVSIWAVAVVLIVVFVILGIV